MNSDDKDERKLSIQTCKGNDSEHGIREKHTPDAPDTPGRGWSYSHGRCDRFAPISPSSPQNSCWFGLIYYFSL